MPITGKCKLCLMEGVELLESHFVSRKLYYSGKKKLEFVNLIDAGIDPEELKAHLLCRECEKRFSVNGEVEGPEARRSEIRPEAPSACGENESGMGARQ